MAASRQALWSRRALNDINGIWDYYANVAGPEVADRLTRDIHRVVKLLEDHPLAGRARDEARPGMRSMAANPHVIFYRVDGRQPQIVRVVDGRRDVDEVLNTDLDADF